MSGVRPPGPLLPRRTAGDGAPGPAASRARTGRAAPVLRDTAGATGGEDGAGTSDGRDSARPPGDRRPAVRGRRGDERGSALVEVVWLGILLLLPMLWIVLSVFEVQRGAFSVEAAARSAARAYALAGEDALGRSRAEAAARQALTDQGLEDAPLDVRVSCTTPPACHSGTSVITVVVGIQVDLPVLPDVLGTGRPRFALDATHTVPIGRFQEVAGP